MQRRGHARMPGLRGSDEMQLRLRLSEGAPESTTADRPVRAAAEPLSAERITEILSRVEPLAQDPAERRDFAFPPQPVPPPKTGRTIANAFPPVQGPAPPESVAKPLMVLQHGPEGDVPTATQLSVTFSEPMVAVTSVEQLKQAEVPLKLTPQPPGQWRWVGTKSLLFVPDHRFPMATRYTAEVPAGTKCLAGTELAEAHRWEFVLPPPRLIASYPNHSSVPLEPLLFAAFDQKIDPAAVLAKLTVWAGDKPVTVRLASQAEIDADETVSRLAQQTLAGRWLAFRAEKPLPTGSGVTVQFAAGTPSAEGPLTADQPQSFTFQTYAALAVSYQSCKPEDRCPPGSPLVIGFNNPLDYESLEGAVVNVEPELPGLRTEINGNSLVIAGRTAGRTTYRATISAGIRDTFGQTLGKDQTLTFHIGSAYPNLFASAGELVVADPLGPPRFSVYSTTYKKLRVRLYSVRPEDYDAYRTYLVDGRRNDPRRDNAPPPGRLALDEQIAVQGPPDQLNETGIDLSKALVDGLGHVIVLVEPSPKPGKDEPYPVLRHWVQRTKLGLAALWDGTDLTAWVNSLADGKPAEGVKLRLWPSTDEKPSDAAGTARFELAAQIPAGSGLLLAERGPDRALLPKDQYGWGPGNGWQKSSPYDHLKWFVFDDRQMYRPGETVHVKGWLRKITGGRHGDVSAAGGSASTAQYQLSDSQGNEILKGDVKIGALGGFDLKFDLPSGMNLGYAQLLLTAVGEPNAGVAGGQTHHHAVQVQEFRRPEFEVSTSASQAPHVVRGSATVTVAASYYAGGPLPGADAQWTVTTSTGHFSPPGWQEFTFGSWTPWWIMGNVMRGGRHGMHNEFIDFGGGMGGQAQSYSGMTDAFGKHHLRIDFDEVDPPRAMNVTAAAGVMDVNRQMWNSSTTLLVHPAVVYVGLKPLRTFVEAGQPLEVDAIVPDLDGKPSAGRTIRLRCLRVEWGYRQGRWQETEVDVQELELKSAVEPVRFSIATSEGGTYRLKATVLDDLERENQTDLTMYVSGGKLPPQRDVQQQAVELIPSAREYADGDTAEILVRAPFAPAEGIVTISRSGILESRRFVMEGATHTLRVPIIEAHVPNVHVRVDLVGAAPRTDDAGQAQAKLPPRPAFAAGELNLPVPPRKRTLQVTAMPREAAISPGAETEVSVTVTGAGGEPAAGAEVALVVVDEAILSLTGYRLPDPLGTFYVQRESGLSTRHLREHVVLARPEDAALEQQMADGAPGEGAAFAAGGAMKSMMRRGLAMESAAPMAAPTLGKNVADAEQQGPIALRSDFNPLAAFIPTLMTDAAGKAVAKFKLPDNLTRYRVMAVAVHGPNHFGGGEATLTARLPLMVRPSPPRFLNYGDEFELPVVLQNQTDAPFTAEVALRVANLRLPAGDAVRTAGWRVEVPANDRVEVRFPAAAQQPGTARFQVAAVAGAAADAATLSLPVWTPATTEAFATYGQIDDQAPTVQPVVMPPDVIRQFGGLELSTSSTALAALTDAVIYLVDYPFGCAEQISSRVLALAALKDVLTAFAAEQLPAPAALSAAVEQDLRELQKMQNPDGGFGFWRQGERSWPYLGIHAAHALARAQQKDYTVPEEMRERSMNYLRNIEQMIPAEYPKSCRAALQAYAYYVRERLGEDAQSEALALLKQHELKDLPIDAVGWLLAVLADADAAPQRKAIRQYLGNKATQTASTAQFSTGHAEGTSYLILHSDRRTDAIVLDALMADDANNPLIPKLVTGLLAHRQRGHWTNTQENVFVLLALDLYFGKYERQTPDFVARAWLGPQYAAEHAYRGRTTDQRLTSVPMELLGEPGATTNLTLAKAGQGRLYYRLGLRYAPSDLNLPAADYGFNVERKYSAVDNPEDVRRDSDGTWRIRAGAKVRVELTMVAPERRYHVALVDPLPAGLEPTNPALAVSGDAPPVGSVTAGGGPWWWRWFEHQNMRDQRVEAFASLVYGGVYTYSYEARATTPGRFVAPPTKAEEMYAPETFGRGATDRVIVEAAP